MKTERTPVDAILPKAKERIQRMRVERLRARGRYRELVLWLLGEPEPWQPEEGNDVFQSRAVRAPLARRMEPKPEDLVGALREESPDPLPAPIREYIVTRYLLLTTPRKSGPRSRRSTEEDDCIFLFYVRALMAALDAHEADGSPKTRAVKTHAKDRTAKQFNIKGRTIDNILASRRLLKSSPK